MKKEELLESLEYAYRFPRTKPPKDERAYRKIVALINKEVTEEWIEDKALILLTISFAPNEAKNRRMVNEYKDFIRSLMGELSITVDPHIKSGK